MEKTAFKTYLSTLLILLIVFALTLTAFACGTSDKKTNEETTTETDFESLVENGDFTHYEGSTQPYTPTGWEKSNPGAHSDDAEVVSGIIDTGTDYDKNRSAWGNLANPFGKVTDKKVLMIYNKEENVTGYKASFKTDAYSYYTVSVKIKVVDATGGGATFRLTSDNAAASFSDLNATDDFTTYTFYLASSSANDTSVDLYLSLGYNTSKVKGYAFFYDVIATKIALEAYETAKADNTLTNTKFVNMVYPDGEFNYYNYSSSETEVHSPKAWEWKTKETSNATVKKGIIEIPAAEGDWTETMTDNYGAYPSLPVANSEDRNVLMIEANSTTSTPYAPIAAYYNSNNKVRIDISSLYKITLWAKVTVDSDDAVQGSDKVRGARVVLDAAGTGFAKETYSSFVINTTDRLAENNGWVQVTIYVLGNQYVGREFNLQLWLGDETANDTLTQGKAFFDKLTIEKMGTYALNELQTKADTCTNEKTLGAFTDFFDMRSTAESMIANGDFATDDNADGLPDGFTFAAVDNIKVAMGKDVIVKVLDKAVLTAEEWTDANKTTYGLDENPGYPYAYSSVLLVNNLIPTAYSFTTDYYTIEQNLCYKMTIWLKTVLPDEKDTISVKVEGENGTSLSNFDASTYSVKENRTNGYDEYVFYFKGGLSSLEGTSNDNKVRLVISNGSGTTYNPSSYKKGAFLIASLSMEKITYAEYNKKVGSHAESKDFASNSSPSITNGNFDSYTADKTEINQTTGYVALSDKDGNTHLTAGISEWTNNVSDKYGTTKVNGEKYDSQTKTLAKTAENNSNNSAQVNLVGKKITTISATGPDGYNKTFNKESEWKKVFNVNTVTGKITWKTTETSKDYTLNKTAENNNLNTFTVDLTDAEITKIVVKGPDSYSKTYTKADDWAALFSIDAEGKVVWASNTTVGDLTEGKYTVTVYTDLKVGDYELTIKTDEEEYNNLIAGIINIDNTAAYLAQFNLTKESIYADGWSPSVSSDTSLKDVDFGAPNLLMLTTRGTATVTLKDSDDSSSDNTANTPAVKSPSIDLSANSYYLLKCYAKAVGTAVGQIYLTTNSTDVEVAGYTVSETNGWVEYNFLVETGLTKVNAYFEIYYGKKGDITTPYSGTLLFDSFSSTELTEQKYTTLSANESTQKSKFTTITFDNTSAKTTAVAPSGFSKSNSSTDTKTIVSGIISKNFEFVTESDSEDEDDTTIKENIGLIETKTETDDNGTETKKDVIMEGTVLTMEDIFESGLADGMTVGDYLLMINNRKATYQSYYLSSLSLSANSYYKFSAYVRTAHVAKDKSAAVYVSTNSGNDKFTFKVNTEYDKDGNEIENKWQLLTFYLKNEKDESDNCSLYFQLGESSSNEIQGYFFIDNISLSEITEDDYNTATEGKEEYEKDEDGNEVLDDDGNKILTSYGLANKIIVLSKDETTEEEDTTNTSTGSTHDASLLWAYITSIVIALVLIAVIVAWLFKKYYRPGKHTKAKKAGYDRSNVKKEESDDAKSTGSARDEYKD